MGYANPSEDGALCWPRVGWQIRAATCFLKVADSDTGRARLYCCCRFRLKKKKKTSAKQINTLQRQHKFKVKGKKMTWLHFICLSSGHTFSFSARWNGESRFCGVNQQLI